MKVRSPVKSKSLFLPVEKSRIFSGSRNAYRGAALVTGDHCLYKFSSRNGSAKAGKVRFET